MQAKISFSRSGVFGLALVGALAAQQASAVTFATFSQPQGTPLGFQINPDLSFSSINAVGDAVVLNFVNQGTLAGTTYSAYLSVSGALDPGTGISVGGNLLQNFTEVSLQFWSQPNKTGQLLLRVDAFAGSILSGAPYNSAGASSTSVTFSSDVAALDNGMGGGELNTLFANNRALAFNLNDLDPTAAIGNENNLMPFQANIGGSFSAIPEPMSLIGLGLAAGLALVARRRE